MAQKFKRAWDIFKRNLACAWDVLGGLQKKIWI